MKFTNPYFLFALFAVLLPVIIHLFNFRRYKVFYFSNVRLLQDIVQKTKRESRLQHIIVLLLRILGISALVFAFAQPYIPQNNSENAKNGSLISIFVDNSFSMGAESQDGTLLQEAVEDAKRVIEAFQFSDDFVLTTQDFSAKQSQVLNKDEILALLDEIEISPNNRSLQEIVSFENSTCAASDKANRIHYYISDFQKNSFDFSQVKDPGKGSSFMIPLSSKQENNISIDSCWFLVPVFKLGQPVTLTVRVRNYGNADVVKLPLKLTVNKEQKAIAGVDVKAGGYTDYQLHYTISSVGTQCAVLEINDSPIVFDDSFYFVYEVTPSTRIIAIQEKNTNRYLQAMYGRDSLFVLDNMNENQVNYSKFKESQLVVLNDLKTISSGLISELQKFVNAGGNVLVFPSAELDPGSWQQFSNALGCDGYRNLIKQSLKVGKINRESIYFKGSLEKQEGHVEMPAVLEYYELGGAKNTSREWIMQLENGAPLLASYRVGNGKVILSAVGLNDVFGSAHKHALFFIPIHNIGIMSQIQGKLYNIIGRDHFQEIARKNRNAEDIFVIKSRKNEEEFIPEQKNNGNETILYFHSQVKDAGFYDVEKDKMSQAVLAFNFDRKESDLQYYSEEDLVKISKNKAYPFEVVEATAKDLTKSITDKLNGIQLWRYCILLALLAFLAEVLLLRFWSKASYEK